MGMSVGMSLDGCRCQGTMVAAWRAGMGIGTGTGQAVDWGGKWKWEERGGAWGADLSSRASQPTREKVRLLCLPRSLFLMRAYHAPRVPAYLPVKVIRLRGEERDTEPGGSWPESVEKHTRWSY